MNGSLFVSSAGVTADLDALVAAGAGLKLMGYSVRESDGTPAVATARIMHAATGASGSPMVFIELAANGCQTQWFGPDGIECPAGISVDHIAGTLDITVYHKYE